MRTIKQSVLSIAVVALSGSAMAFGNISGPSASASSTANPRATAIAGSLAASKAQAGAVSGSVGVGKVRNQTTVNNNDGDYSDMVPSVNAYAPAPTVPCFRPGGLSLVFSGFGGGLGGGTIDETCVMRELIRLGQASNDAGVQAQANGLLSQELAKFADKPRVPAGSSESASVTGGDGKDETQRLEALGIL